MTTIVAVENKTHVLFGCDSQVSAGRQKSTLEGGKIIRNGDYRIAVAGRLRMLQALKHATLPEMPADAWDVDAFVSTTLGPAIAEVEESVNCEPGESDYLVILRGRVYNIHGDGTYSRSPSKQYSIGSGSHYALGYLHGIHGEATRRDVEQALNAAATHDIGTSAPFLVEKV